MPDPMPTEPTDPPAAPAAPPTLAVARPRATPVATDLAKLEPLLALLYPECEECHRSDRPSIGKIAARLGVSTGTLTRVAKGEAVNITVPQDIAKAVGKSLAEVVDLIWPAS